MDTPLECHLAVRRRAAILTRVEIFAHGLAVSGSVRLAEALVRDEFGASMRRERLRKDNVVRAKAGSHTVGQQKSARTGRARTNDGPQIMRLLLEADVSDSLSAHLDTPALALRAGAARITALPATAVAPCVGVDVRMAPVTHKGDDGIDLARPDEIFSTQVYRYSMQVVPPRHRCHRIAHGEHAGRIDGVGG